MSELYDLYHAWIIDHSRHPRNFGKPPGDRLSASRSNPLCGDDVTVHVLLTGDLISEVHFEGTGCALSQASASMMTLAASGITRVNAENLADSFRRFVGGEPDDPALWLSSLEDGRLTSSEQSPLHQLTAFAPVAKFPARIQCARLAWEALLGALVRCEP